MLLSLFTLYYFYIIGINPSTVGMLITSWVPLGFMLSLNVRKKTNTSPNQLLITFILLSGVLILAFWEPMVSIPISLVYCLSFVLWILYLLWYSPLPVMYSDILIPGKNLPDLNFISIDNKPFYCSTLLGKKVVYIFYRGNWCPICMTQLKELADQYISLKDKDAEVLLISPQPQDKTLMLANKLGTDMYFLTDPKNKMAKLLGIEDVNGTPIAPVLSGTDEDTVLPTVIITDEHGKIIYLDRTDNYRVRPGVESLTSALG